LTEKVFKEWLSRFEEAVRCYQMHKNKEWLDQIEVSKAALTMIYRKQQSEIERLRLS
jgi:hypothetical protein